MEPKLDASPSETIKENPRIRNIELDEIPEINDLAQEIADLSPDEKLNKVSEFIKSNFKSALPPSTVRLPDEEKEKMKKVFDQQTPKKLSECLLLGYGVCLDYNALGKAIFEKLGVPAEFKVGSLEGGPKHTYLDVYINGQWQIFDPFAEVYMQERGSKAKLFHEGYYTQSQTHDKKS